MVKVAVVGLCGMSLFMTVPHFPVPGETLEADSLYNEVGGKGFNQSIAAARYGASVSYLGAIGDDAEGAQCAAILKAEGVDAVMVKDADKRTAYAAILVSKTGENQVTEYLGAELKPSDVDAFEDRIAACDILVLQHEIPAEVNLRAAELAHKYHKPVLLNPAPAREIPEEMKPYIFCVTPNEIEAAAIHASDFPNSVITLGSKGCLINGKTTIPAIKVQAVDTTGAGDTFNGVFAARYAQTGDVADAAKWAVAASGISVTRKNVLYAIPTYEEIAEKVEQIS